MTISIRLTEDEEKVLKRKMEQTGLQKTQLIKQSLFVENPVQIVDHSREKMCIRDRGYSGLLSDFYCLSVS